jgi:hypothetical protein
VGGQGVGQELFEIGLLHVFLLVAKRDLEEATTYEYRCVRRSPRVRSAAQRLWFNNEMQLTGRVLGSVRIRARVIIVSRPAADLGVRQTKRCAMIGSVLVLFAQSLATEASGAQPPLERLRAKLAVEAVSSETTLAGYYTSASKELGNRVGGFLSGEDLYLFPDSTYIYCEWADIEPVTVYDKGKWLATADRLELTSDPDITWDLRREGQYVAVRRAARPKEVVLIGLRERLPTFEREAKDDPELMLLIVGFARERQINPAETAELKKKLMSESWRPEYFRK